MLPFIAICSFTKKNTTMTSSHPAIYLQPILTVEGFADIMRGIVADKFEHKVDSLWDEWTDWFTAYQDTSITHELGDVKSLAKKHFQYMFGIHDSSNKTIGFACLQSGGIHGFQIFSPYRKRGYGKYAYSLMEAWIIETFEDLYNGNIVGIMSNKNAVSFWEKCGFRRCDVDMNKDDIVGFVEMKKKIDRATQPKSPSFLKAKKYMDWKYNPLDDNLSDEE